MTDKLMEISKWILAQGREIAQEALNEKLQEAYDQGRMDAYHADVDHIIADIFNNTMLAINHRKTELYEQGFNTSVPVEKQAELLAYKYIEENLPKIMREYSQS
ncbi:MAG: hypothetical protein HDT16_04915 [Oscillibacter sp.]|nr:hypothetical protein [Oscillibacter sp.]